MVSGGSRGIGAAVARRLHRAGYRLSLGIRSPSRFAPACHFDRPEDVAVFPYEARERHAGSEWVAATLARFGRLDVLVNSAGILRSVPLEDGSEDALDELLEINVKAPFRLIQAALPHLKRSGEGRVVTLVSLSGKRVRNLNAGYQMSKFALLALSHAVRRAGWQHGIRATAICPGWVRTDMAAGAGAAAPPAMTDPEELAELILTIIGLSNTAAIAELAVNCMYEDMI